MTDRGRDDGFVLVVVLLGLSLVAAIALAASYTIRNQSAAQAQLMRTLQARSVADGLVQLAAARAVERSFVDSWRRSSTNGSDVMCRVDDALALISVIDAGGLIDLNAAPLSLLQRLAKGIGLSDVDAASIAGAIGDFRDADDDKALNGAEAPDYGAAGRTFGPKNAVFASPAELDQVLGVSPQIYGRLRPLVTIGSRLPGIDLDAATSEVLKVLAERPETDDADRSTLHALLTQGPLALPVELRSRTTGQVIVVRAEVQLTDGTRFRREAIFELRAQSLLGYVVKDWSVLPAVGVSRAGNLSSPVVSCTDLLIAAQ